MDFDPQKDYYAMLGVAQDASQDEIKKAYRTLAMKHHPDKGGDEEEFKKINEANSVIGDPQKRQQYDGFRAGGFGGFGGGQFGGFGGGTTFDFGNFQGGQVQIDDVFDIFGSMFGGGAPRARKGQSVVLQLNVSFDQAYHGTSTDIEYERATGYEGNQATMEAKKINIDIPPGIASGTALKFSQMGHAGMNGGPHGDLIIKVVIKDDSGFGRQGYDMLYEQQISIYDAILGAKITIQHPDGELEVSIPKGLQIGDVVKVSNKGFAKGSWKRRGDFILIPQIQLPKKVTKKQEKLRKELQNMK